MPPTTLTESADRVAEPPTVRADGLFELSYRLQALRLTAVLPCPVAAPFAVPLSASTQPCPSLPGIATARALIVIVPEPKSADKERLCCFCTITSTALAVAV